MVTPGMWELVSELLDGEKLPISLNRAISGLCDGSMVVVLADAPVGVKAINRQLEALEIRKRKQSNKFFEGLINMLAISAIFFGLIMLGLISWGYINTVS